MLIRGDVKCYYCGFVSGELLAETGSRNVGKRSFKPVAACANQVQQRQGRLRCCRCGGPVYLEEVSVVRDPALRAPETAGEVPPLRERAANGQE
jgi:hypothetical protein